MYSEFPQSTNFGHLMFLHNKNKQNHFLSANYWSLTHLWNSIIHIWSSTFYKQMWNKPGHYRHCFFCDLLAVKLTKLHPNKAKLSPFGIDVIITKKKRIISKVLKTWYWITTFGMVLSLVSQFYIIFFPKFLAL